MSRDNFVGGILNNGCVRGEEVVLGKRCVIKWRGRDYGESEVCELLGVLLGVCKVDMKFIDDWYKCVLTFVGEDGGDESCCMGVGSTAWSALSHACARANERQYKFRRGLIYCVELSGGYRFVGMVVGSDISSVEFILLVISSNSGDEFTLNEGDVMGVSKRIDRGSIRGVGVYGVWFDRSDMLSVEEVEYNMYGKGGGDE